MALVPHKITALAESDADGTDGKNIVAGAVVSLFDSSGAAVTLFDDESGSNGSTAKQTDATGQVVVWVTAGEYKESVNGSTQRTVTIGGRTITSYANTASLENSRPTQTGQRAENRERGNAQYELQPSGYVAMDGDIIAANGRVWRLIISGSAWASHFGVLPDLALDQSDSIQLAIDRVALEGLGVNNSSELKFESGRFIAKELKIPDRVTISGMGRTATELRLADGANTYLIADAKFASDSAFVADRISIKDIGLNGNKANQTVPYSLAVIRGYRCTFENVDFNDSSLHGCLYTEVSFGGVATTGGLAEDTWFKCHFNRNEGAGIFGEIGGTNQLADGVISECIFNGNSLGGKYGDIYLERSAGFKILNNQLYASGYHNIYVAAFSRGVISGNHCDVHGTSAEAGDEPSCIIVASFSANGCSVINNNPLFVNHSGDASPKAINLAGTTESVSCVGNSMAQSGSSTNGVAYKLGNLPNAIFNNSVDSSLPLGVAPLANLEERTFKGDTGQIILKDGAYTTATSAIFYIDVNYLREPTSLSTDTGGDTFVNAFVFKNKSTGATIGGATGVNLLQTQTGKNVVALLFNGLPSGTVGTTLRLEALLDDVGFVVS